MRNISHSEIAKIQSFILKNDISISMNNIDSIDNDLSAVNLKIRNMEYIIQINDEYNDLEYNNDELNFILVFRELKMIQDSLDFLHWCKLNDTNVNNFRLLDYYKKTCSNLGEISEIFMNNKITYFISDLDFQLNSGAMQLLRK